MGVRSKTMLVAMIIVGVGSVLPDALYQRKPSAQANEAQAKSELPARLRGIHSNHEDPIWKDSDKALSQVQKFTQEWGANVLRVHLDLTMDPQRKGSLSERLARLLDQPSYRNILDASRRVDVWLVVDLFPRPQESGWPTGGWKEFWLSSTVQREFCEAWIELAKRFRTRERIIFDLMNEPELGMEWRELASVAATWNKLVRSTCQAIRQAGSQHIVMVEPIWGNVNNLDRLERLEDERVVYSFHFFHPHWFTHQGAKHGGNWPPAKSVRYPGEGYGDYGLAQRQRWDKQALDRLLEPVRAFRRRWPGTRLIMGEGGCIVNALSPDRETWFTHMLELMETHRWDWIAFSGPGFYLERTPAESVVRSFLRLNRSAPVR